MTNTTLRKYAMSFDGCLLDRGFWLYVWRIDAPDRSVLYVGRTGDSSSPNAGSPFTRIGQHLDSRDNAKGNALGRRLREAGISPVECSFRMVAIGPVFPEQADMSAHRPVRDRVARLEKELALLLRDRGYEILGIHQGDGPLDRGLFAAVETLVNDDFPALAET